MKQIVVLSLVLLCACKSVRTVYDESGNVIHEREPGIEKDFSAHLEEQFDKSVTAKKNDQGIMQSYSDKVSRYQRDLDGSKRLDQSFITKEYAGARDSVLGNVSFGGKDKKYNVTEAYPCNMGSAIEKDLHPDFAKANRGVYATEDSFIGAGTKSVDQGVESIDNGKSYSTHASVYTRDTSSGYVESRRDRTPKPRIITRDDYYRKTIEQTRMMLGREPQN